MYSVKDAECRAVENIKSELQTLRLVFFTSFIQSTVLRQRRWTVAVLDWVPKDCLHASFKSHSLSVSHLGLSE